MRAVGLTSFGGPEVLTVVECPDPQPGPGLVRIRVHAASINPTDALFRMGLHVQALLDRPPPYVPGMDAAGVVDAVGEGVTWKVGDRVMAIVFPKGPYGGAYAERVVVPAEAVATAPKGATFAEACTLPMNGLTARLILDRLDLRPGQVLAVTGAAGAVGGYTIQLAVAEGLRVVADANPADESLVRGLGADVIVPRGEGFARAVLAAVPEGVDGLVDAAVIGAPVLPAVRTGGSLAAVRPFTGVAERGITVHEVLVVDYAREPTKLDQLRALAEKGAITLRVARVFAPHQAADAHRLLEAGGNRGRLVIELQGD